MFKGPVIKIFQAIMMLESQQLPQKKRAMYQYILASKQLTQKMNLNHLMLAMTARV
jgi:hypothetical protein